MQAPVSGDVSRDDGPLRWWLAIVVLLGLAARVAYFAQDRSFWGDEAAIALNLQARSYAELAAPLDANQQAPYLFLVSERVILEVFGLSERWLRAPALIASLVSLVAAAFVARRLLSPTSAVLATALLALSPGLVRYSAELKPYSLDALSTVAIAACTALVVAREYRASTLLAIAAVGGIAAWFSYPSVFVLFAAGTMLLVDCLLTRQPRRRLVVVTMMTVFWLMNFVAVWQVSAKHGLQNEYLHSFWQSAFAPLPPTTLWELRKAVEIFFGPVGHLIGLGGIAMGAAFYLVGAVSLFVRNWRLGVVCVLPLLVAMLASSRELYPYVERLALFAVPLYVVTIAEGVTRALAKPRWITAIVAGAMFCAQLARLNDLLDAPERAGVKELLPAISSRALPGDAVYVYANAALPFDLYRETMHRPDLVIQFGQAEIRERAKLIADLRQLAGRARVWFVFSDVQKFLADEEQILVAEVERQAQRRDLVDLPRAKAYLYESPSGLWTSDAPR